MSSLMMSRRVKGRAGPSHRDILLEMASGMKDVISLGRGDPDLPTPPHIVDAAKRALDEGYTHYTHWAGMPELRAAIADKLLKDNGLTYDPQTEIVVTVGCQEAVYIAFQALLDSGDEVIMADPYYPVYVRAIELAGGKAVPIPVRQEDDYVLSPADVRRKITPKTKALAIVSPHNPTGAVYDAGVLRQLADLAKQHGLWIISDEIYEKLLFDGHSHHSVVSPGNRDACILINGFSKAYAMTGWRVGYMAGPKAFMESVHSIKYTLTTCAPAVSQRAALAALTGPQDCIDEFVATYDERRKVVMPGLKRMGMNLGRPAGGLFLYASVDHLDPSAFNFCRRALTEAKVLIFPGTAYGSGEGRLRVSILAPKDRLEVAVQRLESIV